MGVVRVLSSLVLLSAAEDALPDALLVRIVGLLAASELARNLPRNLQQLKDLVALGVIIRHGSAPILTPDKQVKGAVQNVFRLLVLPLGHGRA